MNRPDPAGDLLPILGLSSDARQIVEIALSHPSYVNEGFGSSRESNQRLEFLGDSVLGLIVAERLYLDHPGLHEGQLTERRAIVVREETLYRMAQQMGLSDYLLVGRGADESGDRQRPSVLADAVEAIIGAIYLLEGLCRAREFVLKWLLPLIPDHGNGARDSKSRLQEVLSRKGIRQIDYAVTAERGPDHDKTFTVSLFVEGNRLASGEGKSKKQAEQEAARIVLSEMIKPGSDNS